MYELLLYIVHCLSTRPDFKATKGDLEQWHKGPFNLDTGQVLYLGQLYPSRADLPNENINGIPVRLIHGNGWDRLGYSVLIHRDGEREIITPYNDDQFVDPDEMTWGVAGHNRGARHIAFAGGYGAEKDDDFFTNFTDEQFLSLQMYLKEDLAKHPQVKVAGHNDFTDKKSCPGFSVRKLMDLYEMEQFAYHG